MAPTCLILYVLNACVVRVNSLALILVKTAGSAPVQWMHTDRRISKLSDCPVEMLVVLMVMVLTMMTMVGCQVRAAQYYWQRMGMGRGYMDDRTYHRTQG